MTSGSKRVLTPAQERWRAQYGPWAVITGASDGIGRSIARAAAGTGLNILLVARRHAALAALAAELEPEYGIETAVVPADLGEPSGIDAVIEATADKPVGLLVACAGFGTSGALIESDLKTELNMIDVNCRSVLALSRHFSQRFVRQGRGGLILMSSLVAFQGVPRAANYAATKAYVQVLAEGLKLELAPHGVAVLACAPGPIRSGFAARADMQMGMAQRPEDIAQATLAALGRQTTVRPGWLAKLLEGAMTGMPRWGRSRILGGVMRGMTKHQGRI